MGAKNLVDETKVSSELLQRIPFSCDGFVQPGDQLRRDSWKGARVDIKVTLGPDAAQFGLLISGEVRPNGRAEEVRTKLTDDQRRNLRIAVFGPSGHRLK